MYARVCVCMYVCMYVCMCVSVCMSVCMHVWMCARVGVYGCTTDVHVRVQSCTCPQAHGIRLHAKVLTRASNQCVSAMCFAETCVCVCVSVFLGSASGPWSCALVCALWSPTWRSMVSRVFATRAFPLLCPDVFPSSVRSYGGKCMTTVVDESHGAWQSCQGMPRAYKRWAT